MIPQEKGFDIASEQLEELRRLPNRVPARWCCYTTWFASIFAVALPAIRYPYAISDYFRFVQTCHCLPRQHCWRSPQYTHYRLGCTKTRSAERQRIIGAEASRIAAPMAASDAMLPRRLPIPQAVHLFKPQSRNVKTFLLGDLKGAVLFCEREQPPLPRSLLARRDNFALHWKSFSSSSLLISKLSTSTSAFALKCSGSSSLLHSALRFATLSGPIRPRS